MASTTPSTSKDTKKSCREPEPENARKRHKTESVTFSDPTAFVTLVACIGDDKAKFMVHKEVACHHSMQVFQAAFNSSFVEGETQTYRLEEASRGAVAFLVQYLYGQKIEATQTEARNHNRLDPDLCDQEDIDLIQLWVLADMLHIPKLQNLALATINKIEDETDSIATEILQEVYRLTGPGSNLRRYFVENCALNLDSTEYAKDRHQFPYDMMLESTIFLSNRLQSFRNGSGGDPKFKVSNYLVPEDQD